MKSGRDQKAWVSPYKPSPKLPANNRTEGGTRNIVETGKHATQRQNTKQQ